MVMACSNELSLTDNKEKARVKTKRNSLRCKNHLNDPAALHKSQVFQRFHHGNVTIYNHRDDAEEPAEDTKPQFL